MQNDTEQVVREVPQFGRFDYRAVWPFSYVALDRVPALLLLAGLIFLSSTHVVGEWSGVAIDFYAYFHPLSHSTSTSVSITTPQVVDMVDDFYADPPPYLLFMFVCQKLVHITLFFGLGFLLCSSLRLPTKTRCSASIAIAFVIGTSSEILQFYTGRDPMLADVLINTISGTIGAAVADSASLFGSHRHAISASERTAELS